MPAEWNAQFVSAATPAEAGDPATYFRRDFDVTEPIEKATLRITGLGIVVPYLNGARVGDEVLAPGWTSYRHRLMVSTYDVTELVAFGTNTVGATVGEGWAVGALSWEHKRHNYADRPALFAELELAYADRIDVIGTDELFEVGTGAVRANGIYAGEEFDARLEPIGWNRPGFRNPDWSPAEPFEWSIDSLEMPSGPPIRRIEELAPIDIQTRPSGQAIIDFGQNISGWIRITGTGQAGQTVTLRHAEILTPDGELETETNRGAAATDRYTFRGDTEESWEPEFTFHGFRYVEVDGWPGQPIADNFRAVVVHSDMDRTGWFTSSNPLLTKLHENTVWSMRGNFVGVPTDCPQRDERLGWTGDLNLFSPTATFLYDVRGMLGSWLQDLIVEQREIGTVPWVVPNVQALWTTPSPTAIWSDVAVSLPWTLFQEYGDLEILRRSYESMTSFFRQVEAALDEQGLWTTGFQWGDWLDPDAPPENPSGGKTDRYLLASAYLCKTSREIAETAGLLGHDQDAQHFRQLHERVRAAFRHEYLTGSGRIVDEAATAYALAIEFDILDENQKQRAGDRLADIVAKADYKISTGFAGTPLVTHALSSTGHLDTAYRLLLQEESPSFLYPITMGATTVWERWDSVLPDGTVNATGMTSLNHYALGAIADWLHRVVVGLVRTEPGWRQFRIAPQPGGRLMSASAAHNTVNGRVEVSWRVSNGEMHLEATVPEGTTATVILPLHPEGLTEKVNAGTYSWRYPAPEGYGDAIRFTMDTPMNQLIEEPQIWQAVQDVFGSHLPEVPLDQAAVHMGGLSLNAVLERVPEPSPELARHLQSALAVSGETD